MTARMPLGGALDGNSSFSRLTPGLQVAWDSTSLGALKECPRKYYYSHVLSLTPLSTSHHLTFGLLYHRGIELYAHARTQGQDHDQALASSLRQILRATWNSSLRRPWASGDPQKNRLTLIRTLVWYLDEFKGDFFTTLTLANGRPAVEVSFKLDIGIKTGDDEDVILCGHLDRLAKDPDGKVWLLDAKTTTHTISQSFFDRFAPDNQMDLYDFAGQSILAEPLNGIVIDAAQIAVTFSRFQRGRVYRTPELRDEWLDGLPFWLAQAETYAKLGHWPMNTKSCGNYAGCQFRQLCSTPPTARNAWIKSSFGERTWDPLQARGDI